MRISPVLCGSAALAITLGFAVATTGAPAKHKMAAHPASSALVVKGKALVAAKHCNACHSPDLKGKKGFSPSLYSSTRPMSHYTEKTFVRLLTTGRDEEGKPVRPPMNNACHQTPADAKAIYAYLKTLK